MQEDEECQLSHHSPILHSSSIRDESKDLGRKDITYLVVPPRSLPTQPPMVVCKMEAQLEHVRYTLHVHFFAPLALILCAQSVLICKISASELRQKFIMSALLVGYHIKQPTQVFSSTYSSFFPFLRAGWGRGRPRMPSRQKGGGKRNFLFLLSVLKCLGMSFSSCSLMGISRVHLINPPSSIHIWKVDTCTTNGGGGGDGLKV